MPSCSIKDMTAMISVLMKESRESSSMSKSAFAKQLGISRPYLYKIEAGEFDPKLSELDRLCDALGVRMRLEIESASEQENPV